MSTRAVDILLYILALIAFVAAGYFAGRRAPAPPETNRAIALIAIGLALVTLVPFIALLQA